MEDIKLARVSVLPFAIIYNRDRGSEKAPESVVVFEFFSI
jgi:hypothetical protein